MARVVRIIANGANDSEDIARTFLCLMQRLYGQTVASSDIVQRACIEETASGDIIMRVDSAEGTSIPFHHAQDCPARHYSNRPEAKLDPLSHQPVKIGVAVLAVNLKGEVLLTRRAATLSLFPGYWVMPGGHVEPNESLIQAGLRELREETGIDGELEDGQPLALWESVYPDQINKGTPRKQHLVIFFAVRIRSETPTVTLQVEECDDYLWISRDSLNELFNPQSQQRVVFRDGTDTSSSQFINILAAGHRFALQQWLNAKL